LVSRAQGSQDPGDPASVAARIERAGANHVMAFDLPSQPGLQAYLAGRGARRIDANGAAELYWLPPVAPFPVQHRGDGASEIPLARPWPVVGQVAMVLACDAPGEPVAVGWSLPADIGPPAGPWAWVTCDQDGRAVATAQFTAGADARPLQFTANPALADSGMQVSVLDAYVDVRRDFHAQTALADWVSPWSCMRACPGKSTTIAPLMRGPFLPR
jgi:hypothetical protein